MAQSLTRPHGTTLEYRPCRFRRTISVFSHLALLVILLSLTADNRPAIRSAEIRPGVGRLARAVWAAYGSGNKIARPRPPDASAAILSDSAEEGTRVDKLRDSARQALFRGEVDRAIDRLSAAIELDPDNAEVRNDIAAARLQRGVARGDSYEVFLALVDSNRAVDLDSDLPAARFNRALALGHLSLRSKAIVEWQAQQRVETDPLWAREGRERAGAIAWPTRRDGFEARLREVEDAVLSGDSERAEAIVRRSPQRFREHVEEALLPAWAGIEGADLQAANRRLDLARAIGKGLLQSGGDPLVAAAIAQIDHLRKSAPHRLVGLQHGLWSFGRGMALIREGEFSRALEKFRTAQRFFTRQGSPFAGWSAFWLAVCHYERSEYRQALSLLRPLAEDQRDARYPALRGRSFLMIGLIDLIEGRPTSSVTAYEAALIEFGSISDSLYLIKTRSLIAVNYYYLGQIVEAWRWIHPALALSETDPDAPLLRYGVCETASLLAREQGEDEIALWFQDEVVGSARASGMPFAVIGALLARAEIFIALERYADANRDLEMAAQTLPSVADAPTRRSLEGDFLLAKGQVERYLSPLRAVATLSAAIDILRDTSYRSKMVKALHLRAEAAIALGLMNQAESDLNAAIAESERQRQQIVSPQERISYFDQTRQIFDVIMTLQVGRRLHGDMILRYSEQAKGRVLRDWLLTRPTGRVLPKELPESGTKLRNFRAFSRRLPPNTAAIEYAVLPRQLLIWVLHSGTITLEQVAVDSQVLEDAVRRLNRALVSGLEEEATRISTRLYDLVLRPVEEHLSIHRRLVLVPDRALNNLAFAFLRNTRTGRFLIEDHILSVTPSLQIFATNLERDQKLARQSERRALVFVDPDFDRGINPALPRLPGARTDVAVEQLFPGSQLLRGKEATRRAFLRLAGDFTIVHFGGHAQVNAQYPLLSRMLFASESRDPNRGVLYSGDLLGQNFRRTRLVVLAGCSTATGRTSSTEGIESLAWPFLAAGVPAVVASLWEISDRSTTAFMAAFYRSLKSNFDPAGALQDAQTAALRSEFSSTADPRTWAAFELIGASSADR